MRGNGLRAKLLESQLRDLLADRFGKEIAAPAPAKINLRLKVLGRRDDGYHILSMLNCSASLCDNVVVKLLPEPRVSLELVPSGLLHDPPEHNLAVRAYHAFWRAFDFEQAPIGALIRVEKVIPIGAGLGGGSSDAATVLRVLSGVFRTVLQGDFGLSDESYKSALVGAALTCGADVPYFLSGGLCRVSGVGEVVEPVPGSDLLPYEVLLAVPPTPVPTRAFYDHYRAAHPMVPPALDEELDRYIQEPERGIGGLVENDFEADVVSMVPAVGNALAVLRGALPGLSGLTGSGCAVFGLVPEGQDGTVDFLSAELERQGCRCFRARVLGPQADCEVG